ncbi:hypothetical protein EJB05_33164, partial [Eragrostis curvula]
MLNSKDLSFVGYTYKNFEAVKGLHQSADNHGKEKEVDRFDLLVSFLSCGPRMLADLQRSSSMTRRSTDSTRDTTDMDSSMEPNGRDTHMRTVSSDDPMVP